MGQAGSHGSGPAANLLSLSFTLYKAEVGRPTLRFKETCYLYLKPISETMRCLGQGGPSLAALITVGDS